MPELSDCRATDPGPRRKRRLRFPPNGAPLKGMARVMHLLHGLGAFPYHWIVGAYRGVPGLRFRWVCFCAGLRLMFVRGHLADAYRCIVTPMDSVRHFEMAFFWDRALQSMPIRILDVASPRLFTLMLLRRGQHMTAEFLNPDGKDLVRTKILARALGVEERCRFIHAKIDELHSNASVYSLVICMSVLEHITDDVQAMQIMWERVSPGGSLLLSVPCSARGFEEFTNVDEYELLERDEEGFVFWQRYYDEARLQQLFEIAGTPAHRALYAERTPGVYDADVLAKRTDPRYPHWREPSVTAKGYGLSNSIAALPGMGVVAMEFTKQADFDQ